MPRIACLASSDDAVVLRVDLRCCGCLSESLTLVEIDRPPGSASAPALFRRRKMWSRLPFRCPACEHALAMMVSVTDAKAEDFSQAARQERAFPTPRPDPYPGLPRATTLSRMFGAMLRDVAA